MILKTPADRRGARAAALPSSPSAVLPNIEREGFYMCIYIYIYIQVDICIYIYVCVCLSLYIYVCTHVFF